MHIDWPRAIIWLSVFSAAIGLTGACMGGGGSCQLAVGGCPCYPNGTCEPGYSCGDDDRCTGSGADAGNVNGSSGSGGLNGGGGAVGSSGSSGAAAGGSSVTGCAIGWQMCGGCVNTQDNPLHCGGCDQECDAGDVCQNGQCMHIADCTATPCVGFTYCDLVTKQCNPGCGSAQVCGLNETCDLDSHTCVCAPGFHDCQGSCVSNESIDSCGASCTPCAAPTGGSATCDGVSCAQECPPSTFQCGDGCYPGSGPSAEVCGAFCQPCIPMEHATVVCADPACQYTCDNGYTLACGRCVPNAGGDPCTSNSQCCAETGQVCIAGFCNVPYRPCNPGCPPGMQCSLGYCAPSCTVHQDCPAYYPSAPDIFMVCNDSLCGMSCGNGVHNCPGPGWSCNTVTAYRCEWN